MITKTTNELIFRYHEFKRSDGKGWLNEQETLQNPSVTIEERETGEDVSNDMVDMVGVYNNTSVRYRLKAGVSGEFYNISILVQTTNNQTFEDTAEINPDLVVRVI